jgi:uncharacterized glyoxalase superfamily protein PhnB
MPWITPYLTVRDSDRAIDFYERAFGFSAGTEVPLPDGRTGHVEMHWKDGQVVVMFGPEGGFDKECRAPATSGTKSPVSLYVYCDDPDAIYARALAAGAASTMEPQDAFWGDRVCGLRDPDGHLWNFGRNLKPVG